MVYKWFRGLRHLAEWVYFRGLKVLRGLSGLRGLRGLKALS